MKKRVSASTLSKRVEIRKPDKTLVATVWADDNADLYRGRQIQLPVSLRNPNTSQYSIRYRNDIDRGMYLIDSGRLFFIEAAVRDNRKQVIDIVCTELTGVNATYHSVAAGDIPVQAFVVNAPDYIDTFNDVQEPRRIVEVPVYELQAGFALGDAITINSTRYPIQDAKEQGEDGAVLGLFI